MSRLETWARVLKRDTVAIYLAARDPRTPWIAKALAAFVVAYALSPIDLIPDFIPVIGYLDDLILVPLGIWIALKLIPDDVLSDCRARAGDAMALPYSRTAAVIVVLIWVAAAILTGWAVYTAAAAETRAFIRLSAIGVMPR